MQRIFIFATITSALLPVLGPQRSATAQGEAGVVDVKLGATVQRTLDQVQADHYAYGPRQEYDAKSGETHVYLPYGKDSKLYSAVRGTLTDPTAKGLALFVSQDGNTSAVLTYKLHFDKRIGSFRYWAGWSEIGLSETTVAGVEYSSDGIEWKPMVEIKGPKSSIVEPLVSNFKAEGLNTDTLYVRYFTRDPNNPDGDGPGRWLKLRMSGDPSWGDAATTFFNCQHQIWVVPATVGAGGGPAVGPASPAANPGAGVGPATGRPAASSPARPGTPGPRDDASPWGIGSGAEWAGQYPKFNPMLQEAGVHWVRLFTEWQVIQPKQGQWNWQVPDGIVANARANHLHVTGMWAYFAPWASADGGTRKGPIKDMQFWRDYVSETVKRYQKDIKYWEVWNEFNGSFYEGRQGADKVKDYADLVVAAYDTVKKIDPSIKIGLSVANFDLAFLDAAIKAGAADHFDYICVHPYENLGAVAEGGEVGFLSLAGNLRDMLAANNQRKDIPLWITEIGDRAPVKADPGRDTQQADMLMKAYLLSIVQGFDRIFWFEVRGPDYGGGMDFGIIRPDWTPRPSYDAFKTMTTWLGQDPRCLGWLDLGKGGYGFLFQGQEGKLLTAWAAAGKEYKAKFDTEVDVIDSSGKKTALAAGQDLSLTADPVFITRLPEDMVTQAQANRGKPYPWGGDYAHATVVTCRLGAANREDGLKQVNPQTTVVVNGLTETCRRTDFANPALHNEGHYVYFRVDPQFVPFGTKNLEITIVAKRVAPDKDAGMNLLYESTKGYVNAGIWWTIPGDGQWHENTWKVSDASFVGQWGWNFRFDAVSSPNEFLVKEVRVSKTPASPAPTVAVVPITRSEGTFSTGDNVQARAASVKASDTTAVSASDFLHSIGVCTHISQGKDQPTRVAECLAYAGIRAIRDDGTGNPAALQAFIDVHRASGAKIVLLPRTGDIAASLNQYEVLAAAGALLAAEGPNEPNNWHVTYQGASSSNKTSIPIALFQRDLYAAVKADPRLAGIPVFHSSESGGSQPDNCGLQFLTIPSGAGALMPDGTKYADYANTHNYVCGHNLKGITQDNIAWNAEDPTLNGEWDGLYVEYGHTWWGKGFNGYSRAQLETLPRVTTETGWSTRIGGGGNSSAISEEEQGKLFLNLYLAAFKQGWSYTFIYMLRDHPADGYWGFVHTDYTPKLSAAYLHNLTTILADKPSTFTPQKLNYSIPDKPTAVHDLLLQKSNGTFELVVWGEQAKGTSSVTVNLGSVCPAVNVYDPTVGMTAIQTLTNVSSVPLTLSDHPVVIEVPRQTLLSSKTQK